MARIRSVKPELRTDLTVAEWTRERRYAFVLLWGYCDDQGRGVDDLRLLSSDLFPLDRDITERKLDGWLQQMADAGRICRYEAEGRRFLHVINWHHQRINRPTKSRIPPCPFHGGEDERGAESSVNAHPQLTEASVSDSVSPHVPLTEGSLPRAQAGAPADLGSKGAREQVIATEPPRKRGTPTPDLFPITDLMRSWGSQNCPSVRNPERETRQFLDHHRAKGTVAKDWAASWRTWMTNAQKYAERDGVPAVSVSGDVSSAWAREQG